MNTLVDRFAAAGLVYRPAKRSRGRPPTRDTDFEETHRLVDSVGISEACRRMNVSRQGYYYYLKHRRHA